MKKVWLSCMRVGKNDCNLDVRILVMNFSRTESTLIGRKSATVCASIFLGIRVI
jgi:hypothetical protein